MLSDEKVAHVCHQANMGHQAVRGDNQPSEPWHSLPYHLRAFAIDAVHLIRTGEIKSPGEHHDRWYHLMKAAGYSQGPEKDHQERVHPLLLPWEKLNEDQREIAGLFFDIVCSLSGRGSSAAQ